MKKVLLILSAVLIYIISFSINNCSAQWVSANGPYGATIQCMAKSGTYVFAGTYQSGLFLTTNNGVNWSARGFAGQTVYSISSSISGSTTAYIFAGILGSIHRSTNSGSSWTAVYTSANKTFTSIATIGTSIFAGTDGTGIVRSTNSGTNWTTVNSGLTNQYIHCLLASGTNIFAATNGGVFLSTNNGTNWTAVNNGLTNLNVNALAASGINLFAGTWGGGVFISSINGGNWSSINSNLSNRYIRTIEVSGPNIFIANASGIFLSTSPGGNWVNRNQGFTGTPVVNSLLVSGTYIFAGTQSQSVWKRLLSEIITESGNISQNTPDSYSLEQNYPNPFNPVTNIRYTVPKNSFVKLVVYDATGQEIETLVNSAHKPGIYEVIFSGTGYPSGVYFYKLISEAYSETRSMILIK